MAIHMLDTASDEDSFLCVAEHVAKLMNGGELPSAEQADTPAAAFLTECQDMLRREAYDAFLAKALGQLDLVFAKGADKEGDCVANVLVHTLSRISAAQLPAAVQTFASTLVSKTTEPSEQRLGALLNLYGALHNAPALQRQVLLQALDYARRGPKVAAMLVPAVRGKSGEWIRLWQLDDAASRELLIALAALVKVGSDRASVKEYQRLVGCALELCSKDDRQAAEQLRPLAVQAVGDFVRSTAVYQADWAASPAVQALAQDPATQALHALFAAVLAGDMAEFEAAATPAALEVAGTSKDAAQSKARMLALLALCCSAGTQEVSFESIATSLAVSTSQVESWVVRAVGAKLLEARIDQVRGQVRVSRCTQRTFGTSEWSRLAAQLSSWRTALHEVRTMLAENEGMSGTVAAAAAAATGAKQAAVRA